MKKLEVESWKLEVIYDLQFTKVQLVLGEDGACGGDFVGDVAVDDGEEATPVIFAVVSVC